MNRLYCLTHALNIARVICKSAVNLGKTRRRKDDIGISGCFGLEKFLHDNEIHANENARVLQTAADEQSLRILDNLVNRFPARRHIVCTNRIVIFRQRMQRDAAIVHGKSGGTRSNRGLGLDGKLATKHDDYFALGFRDRFTNCVDFRYFNSQLFS